MTDNQKIREERKKKLVVEIAFVENHLCVLFGGLLS